MVTIISIIGWLLFGLLGSYISTKLEDIDYITLSEFIVHLIGGVLTFGIISVVLIIEKYDDVDFKTIYIWRRKK